MGQRDGVDIKRGVLGIDEHSLTSATSPSGLAYVGKNTNTGSSHSDVKPFHPSALSAPSSPSKHVKDSSPKLASKHLHKGTGEDFFPVQHVVDKTTVSTPERIGVEPRREQQRTDCSGKLGTGHQEKNTSSTEVKKSESLKIQKQVYRYEKKRAADELQSILKDPSVVIIADWLKVRGSLKSWTKLWCVVKPGLLVLYKDPKPKSNSWVGTVLLNTCELIERPSKKDGFCLKVFHPLEQSIWATRGPNGESIGALILPLPYSYLIFRIPSEADGRCWLDALEIAQRCSSVISRATGGKGSNRDVGADTSTSQGLTYMSDNIRPPLDDSECEKHFNGCDVDVRTDHETDSDADDNRFGKKSTHDLSVPPIETPYVENIHEELGQPGDGSQTEEIGEENKSLIWPLVKQVRPGMDLSKVVLPTFILEPRSFLDKLSDYYYHANLLSDANLEDDPYTRMKLVVRWYLSGFYKKPKGLKKPYNPIIGETFRCYWKNQQTGSRTFYIAEQICHHPPVTAFYVSNRRDGFVVSGSILAKSKFYGNSLSAILDGAARVTFLKRGEDYIATMPYAHCKGILLGTLAMEYGGKVSIHCEKTGYYCELEFKLKPFLGGSASNRIVGKIKLGNETLATIDGHWDQEIYYVDCRSQLTELFWNPTPEVKAQRLRRFTVAPEAQSDFESEKVWQFVSKAIVSGDTNGATHEKCLVEDAQRSLARQRKALLQEWMPRWFERNPVTNDWIYKYADLRPWDTMNDIVTYELDFIIQTKTRHQMIIVRSTGLTNSDAMVSRHNRSGGHSRQSSCSMHMLGGSRKKSLHQSVPVDDSSGSPHERFNQNSCSGSSSCDDDRENRCTHCVVTTSQTGSSVRSIRLALKPLKTKLLEHNEKLGKLQETVTSIQAQAQVMGQRREMIENGNNNSNLFLIAIIVVVQAFLFWMLK